MNLINQNNFIEQEIPKLHPLSYEYREYWAEQKRRCIEGYWVGGQWMPGFLYFYYNFGTILLNKHKYSKTKEPARPKPLDFLLDLSYYIIEARGLSGFSKQQEIINLEAAYHNTESYLTDDEEQKLLNEIPNIRELLRKPYLSSDALGTPTYYHDAKDFMMLGPREWGKSYFTGNLVLHEFIFDGAKEYNEETIKNPKSSQITVGAHDAKYSNDILRKFKLSFEGMPGGMMVGEKWYPSPFYKTTSGSLAASKQLIQQYEKKIGGKFQKFGSGSTLKHVTYRDNPFAAQGTRNTLMVKEEAGMFENLIKTWEADESTMKSGSRKYGTCIYLGTGGDMSKGTIDAKKLFYNPEAYNILSMPDTFENKGNIAYFLPTTKARIDYKDKDGNTNFDVAEKKEQETRARKKKLSSTAYDSYIEYNPLVPSEMFLVKGHNIFPVNEAQDVLNKLEANDTYMQHETVVELYFDPDHPSGVNYKVDLDNKLRPITDFPLKNEEYLEGAVIIYEFPIEVNGKVPPDLYIIGHDPVRNDTGTSLSSIFVLKNKKYFNQFGHDEIVAEFIGRPERGRIAINETLEKLWMFYGSPPRSIFYENEVGNTLEYFQKKHKVHALSTKLDRVLSKKASGMSNITNTDYGYRMSNQHIKAEAINYARDWLIEDREENGKQIMNIHKVKSRRLLKEILHYNPDGNFDAVMGLVGCIIGLRETYNELQAKEDIETKEVLDFLNNNKSLFPKRMKYA